MRRLALAGALLAVLANGCSKTEDKSSETRIFGEPPVIHNVTFDVTRENISCDVTAYAYGLLCQIGFGNPADFVFSSPTIVVTATVSAFRMTSQVSDPDSTPTESDVLLVGASYVHNAPPIETTLLVFDDGSTLLFPLKQTGEFKQKCTNQATDNFCTACEDAEYPLTSNDTTQNDGIYSRGYAFYGVGGTQRNAVLHNCIAEDLGRAPVADIDVVGKTIEFKIEAVDRSGNIATWPDKPTMQIIPSTMGCTGDPCVCCVITAGDAATECRGLDGFLIPNFPPFDQGFCKAL